MKREIKYSVLQYKHSQLLNEAVNVALLVYFPAEERIAFVLGNVNRIKALYPEFSPSFFQKFIKIIQVRVELLQAKPGNEVSNFDDFIHRNILANDATVLQFTKAAAAIIANRPFDSIVEDYANLFLPDRNADKAPIRHNEQYLVNKIKKSFFANKEVQRKVLPENSFEYNGLNFKFDLGWQNGSLNLIKTLGFDLLDEGSIQNKAVTQFGNLTLLKNKAEDENLRFDLIVSKPQAPRLFKAYDKALDILEQIDVPKKVIEEKQIAVYTEEATAYLLNTIE
jgi:hypothetical protein